VTLSWPPITLKQVAFNRFVIGAREVCKPGLGVIESCLTTKGVALKGPKECVSAGSSLAGSCRARLLALVAFIVIEQVL
jgi:hypothetical protein